MKKLYLSLLLFSFIATSYSQTQLFGGSAGNGNFENGSADWVLVNGTQANKWVVSNNATPGFTGNCIYVSSSAAAPYSHTYNTISSTYSYFYKDVAIPAGATTVWLVFDFICNGQVTAGSFGQEAKDALRIWARPTSDPVVAGQQLNNVFASPAEGYYNQPTWKKQVRYLDVTGFAGGTMRVIFQWFNDGSVGIQPPAALDNIEMYASCQGYLSPSAPGDYITATTASLLWSPISGSTGYEVRWRKLSEPNTVPTYANPHFLSDGNTVSWELEDLTPATTYLCEMRPTGTACSEYGAPLIFNTLTPPPNDTCSGAYTLSVESNACEGTFGSFYGATKSFALSNPCANGDKRDIWFKFTAQQAKQIIQTTGETPGYLYTAKNIRVYSGVCPNLTPVTQPCAIESYSLAALGNVSRMIIDGLTPGSVYYIRVTSIPPDIHDFRICVYNEPPMPQCPELLTPANNTTLNYGAQQEFKWRKGTDAVAYKLKIIQQSGAYTEVNTTDTSYLFSPVAGINYTWSASPYNVLDQNIACTPFAFTTCAVAANPTTISATGSTSKCSLDSVKLTASMATNIQWFLNNQPLAGATSDIFWAKLPGTYMVRLLNGSCYSDLSNTITITNLETPVKPSLQIAGPLTFCEGSTVIFTSSLTNINNQWFKNTAAITGANGDSYTANASGAYYLRVTNSSSGCHNYSDTATVIVNPLPTTPTVSAGGPTTLCQDGSVVLTSNAASGNQWKLNGTDIPGATSSTYTAIASGNYTVIVTSNGCTSNVSAITTVTVNPIPPAPTITAGSMVTFCNGGSVTFTSSSSTGNQWYNGATAITGATNNTYAASTAGTYSVKVTQSGCTSASSNTFTVVVHASPATPTVSWDGAQLSTAPGFAGYQWFLNGTAISGATSATHTPASSGLYKVMILDANACFAISAEFNLVATGITDVTLNGVLYSISPNPAKANLFVKVQGNNPYKVQMRIINTSGAEVMKRENVNQSTTIPVKHLSTGIYYVILTSKKEKATFKIIINN